jgi:photosystem II stability/assembly factor-like uncharacterized protein
MKNSIEATGKTFIRFFLIIISVYILNSNSLSGQWIQQTLPSGDGLILSIDFLNAQKGIAGGWRYDPSGNYIKGKSFYTSDGGEHWLPSSVPDSIRAITNVKYISATTAYAVGAYNKSAADGKTINLQSIFRSGNNYRSAMGVSESPDYSAVLLKTTDCGASWFAFGNVPDEYNYLYQLELIDQQDLLMLGTSQSGNSFRGKLGASSDGGNNWNNVNIPVDEGDLNCLQYINGNIFAAGYEKNYYSGVRGILLRSGDNGITWTKTVYTEDDGFNDMKFADNFTGYACSYYSENSRIQNSRIYRTTDGGIVWNPLNIDLDSVIIHQIGVCRNTGVVTIFGNRYSHNSDNTEFDECIILNSTDFGENWTSQGSGINGNMIFREMVFLNSDNAYIAGFFPGSLSSAGGIDPYIYHTTNGGNAITQNPSNNIPNDFELFQNYPNPFNPVTQIKFSLSRDEFISLKIYSSSGKEIRTLLESRQDAGPHTITFDAADIPSGIYFYTMKTSNYSRTLKMILLK